MYKFTVYKYSGLLCTPSLSISTWVCYVHIQLIQCMLFGECGRLPQCYTYFTTSIKYWCKLLTLSDHRYPKKWSEILHVTFGQCWTYQLGYKCKEYVVYVWYWLCLDRPRSERNIDVFLCQFRQRLKYYLTQNCYRSVNTCSRCHHYMYFKSRLETERY